MTQQRRDSHSTEFGIWLRQQEGIDSKLGYTATNIDFLWTNYKTGEWMLIEEKRYKQEPKFPQTKMFELLHNSIKDDKYRGFYYLVFENTSPDDGRMWLDTKEITKQELIDFLQFK